MPQLKCIDCGNPHKARTDKFPMELRAEKQIKDRSGKVIDSKEVTTGHICKRCARKRITKNKGGAKVL